MSKWISGALAVGTFAVLYYFENRRPLRKQVEPKLRNAARNLAVAAAAGAAINLLEKPVAGRLTKFVERRRFGLLKIVRLPKFLEIALAFVLLDYTLYLWHVLTHKIPFLWRFHKIHHADLDLTVLTAIRFHFAEMAISVIFRAGQILIIGVAPRALEIWQTLLFMSIFFHHSNVRLPKKFEEKLEFFIVTPRLHGIHHSIKKDERDSNWSSGLSLWDLLHGTFRRDIPQAEITIGLKEFETQESVILRKILFEPFAAGKVKRLARGLQDNFSEKCNLSRAGFAAEQRQNLACDVARIGVGREKDERRRDFFGLSGTFHRRVRAVFRHFFRLFVRHV
jgi:sterol desaturase/sphingolipid hydroxylase (fatty acid hydroxylase superfamily)